MTDILEISLTLEGHLKHCFIAQMFHSSPLAAPDSVLRSLTAPPRSYPHLCVGGLLLLVSLDPALVHHLLKEDGVGLWDVTVFKVRLHSAGKHLLLWNGVTAINR